MPEQHGGMRQPRNPAPVPMPGALSRRTDGGPAQTTTPMTGMAYGENADYNDIQSSAPLAAAPSVPNARTRKSSPTGSGAAATPLFAPTGRPEEPVTAGAPFGPGDGPGQPLARTRTSLASTLELMLPYDENGDITSLYEMAVRRGW